MMTKYLEVERKFDAELDASLPDLSTVASAVSEPQETELDATYFDTADARLARHRVTLRRRTGGEDEGWHLKLPAGQDERTEIRLPPGLATRRVPVTLSREVRAFAHGRPLVPVATLRTRRIERKLLDADGKALAIVADDLVHAERPRDGAVEVSSWREIEVELVNGDRSLLDAVGARLRAAGMAPSSSSSKLARALGDTSVASQANGSPRKARGTAAAVVSSYLHVQVDALIGHDRGARSDEPDCVHKMRVACRRLRSTLATCRPLLNRDQSDPVREELKWLAEVLGRPRDAEVLQWRLRDLLAEQPPGLVLGPVASRVTRELTEQHRAAHNDLISALDSKRYFRLLDALDKLVADPPLSARAVRSARKQMPALTRRACRRLDRAALEVAQASTSAARDTALHEVRKKAKQARYAAESAVPVAGRPAERLADRMTAVQDILGEHQDSVTSRELLRELGIAAHDCGENAFTFGLLHAEERSRAEHARSAYEPALLRASTKRARRWTK